MLATTSYPDRTSPVLRGKFLLNNILGLPSPPPPPGVDTNLAEVKPNVPPPTIRERLAQHRTNPSCASCHSVIDPLGFALEQFDAIGAWRTVDESGRPVDSAATTLSGAKLEGLAGLRAFLLAEPEQFPRTVTEKLMAYALGRRLEYYDRPAVRAIVRDAAASNYRWSALIAGIVKSPPFLMRERGRETTNDVPDRKGAATTHGPARAGGLAVVAAPRCDAPRVFDARQGRDDAAHRFLAFYVPNGMAMEYWTPKGEGRDFELSPILEPLAAFRNQMLVLSGVNASWNYIHAGASGSFLTGTTRGGRNEVEILADVSMDQLLARHFASETQVASLELAMDAPANAGACTGHPELRLHAHDLLAQRDAAAADGAQPARGVRAAVRRQRQHRQGGA